MLRLHTLKLRLTVSCHWQQLEQVQVWGRRLLVLPIQVHHDADSE